MRSYQRTLRRGAVFLKEYLSSCPEKDDKNGNEEMSLECTGVEKKMMEA